MNLGEHFVFLKKGLDLDYFAKILLPENISGFYHIDEYFDTQEQFSIHKFIIRDVLDIEFFGAFCGLRAVADLLLKSPLAYAWFNPVTSR